MLAFTAFATLALALPVFGAAPPPLDDRSLPQLACDRGTTTPLSAFLGGMGRAAALTLGPVGETQQLQLSETGDDARFAFESCPGIEGVDYSQ